MCSMYVMYTHTHVHMNAIFGCETSPLMISSVILPSKFVPKFFCSSRHTANTTNVSRSPFVS